MTEVLVTKRIHIGGLTPNITTQHIRDRFRSFGAVSDVEELSPDVHGSPRPFTFFTIQTTPAQLKKCLNIMSGSTWRGATLRLAEAKPKFDIKLENERNPKPEDVANRQEKKRKRLEAKEDLGHMAQDQRPVNSKTISTKKFWTSVEDGRMIRPMCMRPSRPLPQLSSAKPVSVARRPAGRARRRVIDPLAWGSLHFEEGALPGSVGRIEGEWVFEEQSLADLLDEHGKTEVGVWKHISEDGQEIAEEVFRIRLRHPTGAPEDEGEEVEEEDFESGKAASSSRGRSASPLFPIRGSQNDITQRRRNPSPLFPSGGAEESSRQDLESEKASSSRRRSASPLFPDRPIKDALPDRSRSSSPLFPSRSAAASAETRPVGIEDTATTQSLGSPPSSSKTKSLSPEPESDLPVDSEILERSRSYVPADVRAQANNERRRDLGLLSSLLGEAVEDSVARTSATRRRNEWAGFAESDEDDDENLYKAGANTTSSVLRLRGGAGSDEQDDDEDDSENDSDSDEESSDDSDSSSENDDDSDDSSDASTAAQSGSADPIAMGAVPPSGAKSSLKDMFASSAAPSTGFSLAGLGADVEIDDDLDIPITTSALPQPAEDELEGLTLAPKSFFDPSADIPMFFPPPPGRGGAQADEEGKGFWRQETDEDMKAIWERDKLALTREWKTRHRDAKKQRRRKGAADLE